MFERLQKPFLTVETGEAYQPIRMTYAVKNKEALMERLSQLKCCEKNTTTSWNWFWRNECDDLSFESLETFQRKPDRPLRLATMTLRNDKLYINLPSFKRACMAVPFFHKQIEQSTALIERVDFINKVFGIDERLPHGFSELFKEEELDRIIHQRVSDYEKVQEQCENAESAQEALNILADYTNKETKKRLPYAERYQFEHTAEQNPDIAFLGFYIFLRSRELVAIRRWFGDTGYSLSDAADETMEKVFGDMDIDIIE